MINRIGNTPSINATPRSQASAATNAPRAASTLNAVAKKPSAGGSSGALKIFSVPKTADNTPTSNTVPRGSLVDELV